MKFQIRRSIELNKPAETMYKIISDLNQWNTWSPWVHAEPNVKSNVTGSGGVVGQTQRWDGELIGSGKMTLETLEKNQKVILRLEFLKPFKSLAQAVFDIEAMGPSQSRVTWTMNSQMPIFMIFFKKMMTAYMNSDFDRGLQMMKEYAETGTVISKSAYQGEKNFTGFQIVGKKTSCKISEIPDKMHEDFSLIDRLVKSGELTTPQSMMTMYDKYDMPNGNCVYTAALVYGPGTQPKVPAGFQVSTIGNHRGLLVDYYGPYRNLGNPWSMIVSTQRTKKKKILKKIPMYEIYKTMPDGRPEKDIHTQIILPIK